MVDDLEGKLATSEWNKEYWTSDLKKFPKGRCCI